MKAKIKYETPEMDIVAFEVEDIITSSDGTDENDLPPSWNQ